MTERTRFIGLSYNHTIVRKSYKHRSGDPMTAKYYHKLRIFLIIPYFRLTVNLLACFLLF